MSDDQLAADVQRLRHEVDTLTSAVARLAQHLLGRSYDELARMFFVNGGSSDWPGPPRPDLVPEVFTNAARVPLLPVDDVLPRGGRNPRIGCEQYDSGTWIHGLPHDCPRWVRR